MYGSVASEHNDLLIGPTPRTGASCKGNRVTGPKVAMDLHGSVPFQDDQSTRVEYWYLLLLLCFSLFLKSFQGACQTGCQNNWLLETCQFQEGTQVNWFTSPQGTLNGHKQTGSACTTMTVVREFYSPFVRTHVALSFGEDSFENGWANSRE